MKQSMKRLLSILCVVVMLCSIIPAFDLGQVKAETTEKTVMAQEITNGTITPGNGMSETPPESGYVFGGYYDDYNEESHSFSNPITEARDASTNSVFIKWVPEEVMTVNAQVRQGDYEGYDKKVISNCDGVTNESNIEIGHTTDESVCWDEDYVQEGTASFKRQTETSSATLFNLYLENTVDVTGYKYFSCKLYINDTSKLVADTNGEYLYIILSSVDGKIDSGALRFYLTIDELETYAMSGQDGWYELNLPFANADYINVKTTSSEGKTVKTYDGTKVSFIQIRSAKKNTEATMTVCVDDIYVYNENPGFVIADCDRLKAPNSIPTGDDSNAVNVDNSYATLTSDGLLEQEIFMEGMGAIKEECFQHTSSSNAVSYRFDTKIAMSNANKLHLSKDTGLIHLWLYIAKPEYLTKDFVIQLSSSRGDNNRIRYTIDKDNLEPGWNEIIHPLNDSSAETSGTIKWESINYIRVYNTGAIGNGAATDEDKMQQMQEQYMLLDDIRVIDTVQITDCDSKDAIVSGSGYELSTMEEAKKGNAAFVQTDSTKSTVHQLVFENAIDFSTFRGNNGSLHFWFYIDNIDLWKPASGKGLLVRLSVGNEEQDYRIMKENLRTGWNEIYINLDKPAADNPEITWTAIESLLLSCESKSNTKFKTMIDDISLVTGGRNTADVRFVSTVESLSYKQVGFYIKPFYDTSYSSIENWTEAAGSHTSILTTIDNKVYRKLYALGSAQKYDAIVASDVSGLNWTEYMHAATVTNIPNRLWDAEFVVIPYWITQDGTTVIGKTNPPKRYTVNRLVSEPIQEQTDFRIVITSDVHYTTALENHSEYWYGVKLEDRMQLWVNSILEEHERQAIDLIIVNGDVSLDYWVGGGSYLTNGTKETENFMTEYVAQLQEIAPVIVMPGNHEQYDDATWQELTGNSRSGTYELGNNVFIMLDSYYVNQTTQTDSDGIYKPLSVDEVNQLASQIARYADQKVYIVSHMIDMEKQNLADNGAFKALLQERDNIIGLFAGHTHETSVLGSGMETYGGKTVAQTGHFSYFTKDNIEKTTDNFWGFRDLIITKDSASSRYITADCSEYAEQLKTYGVMMPADVNDYGRREIHEIVYY